MNWGGTDVRPTVTTSGRPFEAALLRPLTTAAGSRPSPSLPGTATIEPSLAVIDGSTAGIRSLSSSATNRRSGRWSTSTITGAGREETKLLAQFQTRDRTNPWSPTWKAASVVRAWSTVRPRSVGAGLEAPGRCLDVHLGARVLGGQLGHDGGDGRPVEAADGPVDERDVPVHDRLVGLVVGRPDHAHHGQGRAHEPQADQRPPPAPRPVAEAGVAASAGIASLGHRHGELLGAVRSPVRAPPDAREPLAYAFVLSAGSWVTSGSGGRVPGPGAPSARLLVWSTHPPG